MRKRDELTNPNACMFRAGNDEMTFVLLGRDAAAPETIRFWAWERIRLGKNKPDDPQIQEALACAETMERERASRDSMNHSSPSGVTSVTMPSLMNCAHQGEGWCLECVGKLTEQCDMAQGCLGMIRDTLKALGCQHGLDSHAATPPMMYPEWIRCVVYSAVQKAKHG